MTSLINDQVKLADDQEFDRLYDFDAMRKLRAANHVPEFGDDDWDEVEGLPDLEGDLDKLITANPPDNWFQEASHVAMS